MSTRRRLAALALGLGLAVAPVLGLEGFYRWEEADAGLALLPPPRKFGLDPREELNSLGFREREPAAKSGFRVLVFGDSVTYGIGVQPEQTWTRLAETEGTEILNFGVPGYDAEQVAGTMAEQAPALAPDLLVYAMFSNDHSPTMVLRLHEEEDPVAVDPRGLKWGWAQPWSAIARRWLGAEVVRTLSPSDRGDLTLIEKAVDDMIATAKALGVPLLVFGVPPHVLADADEASCAARAEKPEAYCRNELLLHWDLLRLSRSRGVPFASALPYLQASGQVDFFIPGGRDPWHPNVAGHAVLGEAFADVLRRWRADEGLLAPPKPPRRSGAQEQRRRGPGKGGP